MAETRSSWLGDFTGFSLEETSMVSAPPDTGHVALTPMDLLVRLLAHMQASFALSGISAYSKREKMLEQRWV